MFYSDSGFRTDAPDDKSINEFSIDAMYVCVQYTQHHTTAVHDVWVSSFTHSKCSSSCELSHTSYIAVV